MCFLYLLSLAIATIPRNTMIRVETIMMETCIMITLSEYILNRKRKISLNEFVSSFALFL